MRNEKIVLKCNDCGAHLTIPAGDLDYESSSFERSMGPEYEYTASCELQCEVCKKEITLDHSVWEYPVGAYNYRDVKVSGAVVLEFFDEQATIHDMRYDFDDDFDLYLPHKEEIITSFQIGIANVIIAAEHNRSLIESIDPREFELFVADIFKRQGFSVELTQRTRDGGKDIIAVRSDLDVKTKYLIECKRYKESNKVCVDVVRQLYGVQSAEGANKSIVVTTSSFTKDAIDFATKKNTEWLMSLVDYDKLLKWVKDVYGDSPIII